MKTKLQFVLADKSTASPWRPLSLAAMSEALQNSVEFSWFDEPTKHLIRRTVEQFVRNPPRSISWERHVRVMNIVQVQMTWLQHGISPIYTPGPSRHQATSKQTASMRQWKDWIHTTLTDLRHTLVLWHYDPDTSITSEEIDELFSPAYGLRSDLRLSLEASPDSFYLGNLIEQQPTALFVLPEF